MIVLERLHEILAAFPRLSIGLVGDLFLDRYLEIDARWHELSVETDLEAYQVARIRNTPGALGTVISNLAALGVGRLVPVSVIGDDGHGYDLLRQLAGLPVDCNHILQEPGRLTPTYTKPLRQDESGAWQELHRLDIRSRQPLAEADLQRLLEHTRQVFQETDGLIVLDQISEENHGVIGPPMRDALADLSRRHPEKLIYIDSRAFLGQFSSGVLKGNRAECLAAAGMCDTASVEDAVDRLCRRTGRAAYCTDGDRGILVAQPAAEVMRVPGYPVSGPIDIVGAGDSATSGIVASLLAGADPPEAAALGNLIASITVQKLGTTGTASPQEVIARCREYTRLGESKPTAKP